MHKFWKILMMLVFGLSSLGMQTTAAESQPKPSNALPQPATPPQLNPPTGAAEMVDYSLLDHTVSIQSIRAGNQDESGLNDYYFTLKIV